MFKSKFLYIFIVSMIVIFVSISCGKKQSEDGVIVLKGYSQIDPVSPQYRDEMMIISNFNAEHTNIRIEWEYVSGEPYHQKFQAMAASGNIPDIFIVYLGSRSSYITDRGLVKDLRPYLTDEIKSEYIDLIWEPQGPNGEIYFIPPNLAVSHVIYANKALMDELGLEFPKTQDELLAQGEKIRAAGYTPLAIGNQADWVMNSLFLSALVDRFGGKEWFDKAMKGEAKFTDANFVNALKVIDTLSKNKMFNPGMIQMTQTQALEEFVQGKAVYLIDAGWRISAMNNMMSPEMVENIRLYVYPEIPGETVHNSSTSTLGEGWGISSKLSDEEAKAAMEFMLYVTGKEAAEIKAKGGLITTYKLDYSTIELDPITSKYVEFVDKTPMGYIIDAKMDAEGMGVLNPAIQSMILGEKTPEQVAEEYENWVAQNDSHRIK